MLASSIGTNRAATARATPRRAWADARGLKHRLLSDMHRLVSKSYGLYFPQANINQRATVVIGKDGKVAWVKVEPDITKERDFNEVEAVLAKLA